VVNTVRKLVHGVGINDLPYVIKDCPYYERWRSILCRCYSTKFHKGNKCYKDCEICDEWRYASNFKKWMETKDWMGKVLDKDILYYGNKVYSPEKCIFVPVEVNSLFIKLSRRSEYPLGVYKSATKNKVDVKISIDNKRIFLGSFDDIYEAHRVWQKHKIDYLLILVERQSDVIIKEKIIDLSKTIRNNYLDNKETKYS
jgi:hypothetical protein